MTLKDYSSLKQAHEQAAPIVAEIEATNRLLARRAQACDWVNVAYAQLSRAELDDMFFDGLQKKLAGLSAKLAAIPSPGVPAAEAAAPAAQQPDPHVVPPHGLPRVRICPKCKGGGCERCGNTGAVNLSAQQSAAAELQLIQHEIFAWARTNFGVTTVVANQPAILNMICFLGRLCHAVLKSSQGIRGTPEEHATAAKQAANTLNRAAMVFRENSGMKADRGTTIAIPNVQLAAFLGAMEELGEMAEMLLSRLDEPIDGDNKRAQKVKDGVGDLQVYLLDFCASNGLDAEDCLNTAWAKVSQRDWKKDKLKGGEASDD